MSDRTEMLRQRAADERQRLSEVFDSLEGELDELVDWRAYVRREPLVTIGLAAAGGILAGVATAPQRRSKRTGSRPSFINRATESLAGTTTESLLRKFGPWVLELVAARAIAAYANRQRRAESTT
jgi:hypothetical protein